MAKGSMDSSKTYSNRPLTRSTASVSPHSKNTNKTVGDGKSNHQCPDGSDIIKGWRSGK